MFGSLFRRKPHRELVERLHGEIVAAVRQPWFYLDCAVPDTFEGRFELLMLFGSLAVNRLEGAAPPYDDLAQALTDSIFAHLDIAMRENGVTDTGMAKKMKKNAAAWLGRAHAYREALQNNDGAALADSLSRNVLGAVHGPDSPQVRRLAGYVTKTAGAFDALHIAAIGSEPLPFPSPEHAG